GTTSEGCSGADIELICRKASLAAIREFLESPAARSATLEGFVIRAEHFHTAMRELGAERSEKPGREVAHLDSFFTFRLFPATPKWAPPATRYAGPMSTA